MIGKKRNHVFDPGTRRKRWILEQAVTLTIMVAHKISVNGSGRDHEYLITL